VLSAPAPTATAQLSASPAAVQRHEGHDDEAEVQGAFVQRDADSVQREGEEPEEEEAVQGAFVQREEVGEEEEEPA
jgi:hypothetical protein